VLHLLASTALATLAVAQQIDTTFPVERGQRLEVNAFGGEIVIKAWNRNAVRVQATPPSRTRVEVEQSATTVSVRTEGRRGAPSAVDLRIDAPAWMALEVSGVYTDVSVTGAGGPVSVETVEGSIDVEGGDGLVSLESVSGEVRLRKAKGRIEVNSVNEDVHIADAAGEITAESVNGEIRLDRVQASSLDASTVNGDVVYDGPVRSGGRYALSSHNGDITLTVAEGTNAAVSVSTFNGEFESEFPVALTETRKGKRFSFTLGNGGAQVSLESFQGTIQLVRPGSRAITKNADPDPDPDHDHDR